MSRRIKSKSDELSPKTVSDRKVTTLSDKKPGGTRATKQADDTLRSNIETKIAASGETVWVHNISNSEYHVRPTTDRPENADSAIAFQLNAILPFHPDQVKDMRFKRALLDGKLEIIQESQIEALEHALERAAKSDRTDGKVTKGVNVSGLPNNKKAALAYIYDCEDIEELETYAQDEDRDFIIKAIDDRIEDLEDSGKGLGDE